MQDVFIVGCGDIGLRVGKSLLESGKPARGLVRHPTSVQRLNDHGLQAVAADLDGQLEGDALPEPDALVYYFAPPPACGTTDSRLTNFLHAVHDQKPARIVYISTSGVYGDCAGAWVDEDHPVHPRTDRSKRRLDAERQLLRAMEQDGIEVVILRVAGIYGPGRLPLDRLRAHTPVICPDEAPYSNRIHAEDLAAVCLAAAERGVPGRIYNVADGHPSTMTDFFYRLADLSGLKRPPCVPMSLATERLSPTILSYLHESRRLRTERLLQDLGIQLRYPTLEQGLAAALAEEYSTQRV
ncbi:MAG: SDR family oxidoreductase [Gammaproteobacteria bacterium]